MLRAWNIKMIVWEIGREIIRYCGLSIRPAADKIKQRWDQYMFFYTGSSYLERSKSLITLRVQFSQYHNRPRGVTIKAILQMTIHNTKPDEPQLHPWSRLQHTEPRVTPYISNGRLSEGERQIERTHTKEKRTNLQSGDFRKPSMTVPRNWDRHRTSLPKHIRHEKL